MARQTVIPAVVFPTSPDAAKPWPRLIEAKGLRTAIAASLAFGVGVAGSLGLHTWTPLFIGSAPLAVMLLTHFIFSIYDKQITRLWMPLASLLAALFAWLCFLIFERPTNADPTDVVNNHRLLFAVIASAGFVVGVRGFYVKLIRPHVKPRRWFVVDEGLVYRSGRIETNLLEPTLKRHGIQVIVKLTGHRPDKPGKHYDLAEENAARRLDIDLISVALGGDGTGEPQRYAQAIAAIVKARDAGKPVQVHCAAGVHRTGGVVAAYRMFLQGVDPKDAYDEMLRRDFRTRDNDALIPYLNDNLGVIADELVKLGVIDKAPDPPLQIGK